MLSRFLKKQSIFWIIYLLIIVFALFLRISHLDLLDLWFDEAFTGILVKKNLFDIIRISNNDTSLPLYYIFVHLWTLILGNSTFTLRLLSVLADLASLGLIGVIGKKYFGKIPSLALMLLYSVNIVSIYFAREARSYSLLAFLLLASFYCLIKVFEYKENIRKFCLYGCVFGILTAMVFYVHNLSVFFIFVEVLYFGKNFVEYISQKNISLAVKKSLIFATLGIFLFTALLCLPGLAIIYQQSRKVAQSFWLGFNPLFSLATLKDLISGFLLMGLQTNLLEIILLCLSTYLVFLGTFKKTSLKWILAYFFWAPIILLYLASFFRPLFYSRYLSFLNPFLILLIFKGIVWLFQKNKKLTIFLFTILVTIHFSIFQIYLFNKDTLKPHYKDLVAYIEQNKQPGDKIFHADASTFFSFKYYAQENQIEKIYDPENKTPFFQGKALLEENDFSRSSKDFNTPRIWLIKFSQKTDSDAQKLLQENHYKVTLEQSFKGNIFFKDNQTFDNSLKGELWEKIH